MFTVLLTSVGLIVFFISCFSDSLKIAYSRLVKLIITGIVIDAIITLIVIVSLFCSYPNVVFP